MCFHFSSTYGQDRNNDEDQYQDFQEDYFGEMTDEHVNKMKVIFSMAVPFKK